MSLIVEDGSIVPNANSLISAAFFAAYWLERNITVSNTSDEIDAACIIATQYTGFNNTWKGYIVDDIQSLFYPRREVVDNEGRQIASDSIPLQLQNAIAEYAKRQLDSSIQPDVPDTGTVKSLMTKLDVLEKKTEYQDGTGGYFGIKQYPLADNYLIGLTTGGIFGNFGKVGC